MSSENDNNNSPTKNTFISVTGAALKCDLHGIETFDLDQWNEHCSDPANGHVENGDVPCIDCGTQLHIENYPYVPITPKGKQFNLRCDNCLNNLINQSNLARGVSPK